MTIKCKNCLPKNGIAIPEFTELQRSALILLAASTPLKAIKCLMFDFKLNLFEAKYVITHLNKTYGHCNRCSFQKLDEAYINCPKCGSLNFNWKMETTADVE